jgi:uncharacterized repeat protein (TIGR03943 family)
MKRLDRSLVIVAVAVMVLVVASTDVLTRYVRPTMRPWLLLAGTGLLAVGLVSAWREWRTTATDEEPEHDHDRLAVEEDGHEHGQGQDGHRHGHRPVSRIGWLLLAPLAILVILDPSALGASTVARQQSSLRKARLGSFDLNRHLAAHRHGGQVPPLTVSQFVSAAHDPAAAALLAGTDVRLEGFVVEPTPQGFTLARLQLGCCAGDAVPVVVLVEYAPGVQAAPSSDQWVAVTGRFSPEATGRRVEPDSPVIPDPVLRATEVTPIEPLAEPYEYPF